jgi:hypothetical protein
MRSTTRRGVRVLALAALVALVAACEGSWEKTANPSPVRAVHAALLRTGKVLLIAGSGNSVDEFAAGSFKTAVYDPTTDTFRSDITTPYDLFCGGHAFLPDGRLLVVGGTGAYDDGSGGYIGEKRVRIFNPVSETYQNAPDMAIGRWYPTVVSKGNGTLVATAGYDEKRQHSNTFQIFDPVSQSWSANRPLGNPAPGGVGIYSPLYPSFHLMANGNLFYSGMHAWALGPGTSPYIWNTDTNTVQWLDNNIDVDRRDQGASVLLPPAQDQKVMIIGGDGVASTAVIDLKDPNPRYVEGPPIDAGKMYVSAVILPDGRVLQTGGTDGWRENPDVQYVRSSQILDPKTMTWTKVPDATVDRTYHSGALLLPDGRVLTFGGDPIGGSYQMDVEIYSPGYMSQTRPQITSAPLNVTYGSAFTVRTDTPVGSAVLIRPSAVTHSSDSDQRSVDLAVAPGATSTQLTIPANPNLTPPGWYMLFVRDADGVPSVARWVKVA